MNKTLLERHSKRKSNQARKIHITKDYIHNADASCLINVGKTSIICTASIRGQKIGARITTHFRNVKNSKNLPPFGFSMFEFI